jgi:hypothetical protein
LRSGLPHSDIHGSTPARGSPWLFAACHVLHRLLVPRHPPNALLILDTLASPDRSPGTTMHGNHPQRTIPCGYHLAQITGIHPMHHPPSARAPPCMVHRRTRSHTPLNPRRRPVGRPSREELSRSDIKPDNGTRSNPKIATDRTRPETHQNLIHPDKEQHAVSQETANGTPHPTRTSRPARSACRTQTLRDTVRPNPTVRNTWWRRSGSNR